MKLDYSEGRIFIRPGTTDMRKAANGLLAIVEQAMSGNAFSGSLYLFCGKTRKILKAIWWDGDGFCLWQKRLEKDRYPWPETEEGVKELTEEELGMLLEGIDFFHAHKYLRMRDNE
jgi:transposase